MMNDGALAEFAKGLRGLVIARNHPDYEEARKLYNAMIDKRPLAIARCSNVADVIGAINFGRDNKIPIAVRGGGHNGPGFGSVDDGLVIDLAMMKGVRVDPAKRTVRVDGGCVTGDVDHATSAFGQAVPFGVVSTTGVSGLTLSGGHGYLSRQYGLTVDNLLEADVVLADGKFVTASEAENADLFWALRGGGGNFGVVTSFLFRTSPASVVYGGPIMFALADAAQVARWYLEFQPNAPEELYIFLALQTVPPGDPFPQEHWGKKTCVLVVCYNGPIADAEKALNAVRTALPKPLIDWAQPMPYPVLQSLFDPLLPKGLQWYWKGDFVNSLPDAAIDAHIAHAAKAPTPPPLRDAHLSNRWCGPPSEARCDRMESPRHEVVDGNLRRRSLHDGRRGRGARQSSLRRQLPTACYREEGIRSRQPIPGQSKYPACGVGDSIA
jgi:hypothetical protein